MNIVSLVDVAPLSADRVRPWSGTRGYVATGNADDDGHLDATPLSYSERPSRADLTARPGDVVMARMAATRKVFVVDEHSADYVYSTGFAVFRPDASRVDPQYLKHWFRTADLQSAKDRHSAGATQRAITNSGLTKLTVPLPDIRAQRRLAAILDRADAIRAKRRQILEHLNAVSRSIFQEMFGGQSWPVESLGERLTFLTSGSRGWAKYYAQDGDKFIRIQNVRGGYLNGRDMAFVAAPDTAEAKRTAVQAGDVLLSITADLGRTAVVPAGLGTAYINQHLAILRAPSLSSRYLADFLESPAGQREVLGKDRGATKAGLNFEDIRSVSIPIPPTDSQEQYAAKTAEVNAQREYALTRIAKDDELFASLQFRAFRGEL